jgi:hypothetical protein
MRKRILDIMLVAAAVLAVAAMRESVAPHNATDVAHSQRQVRLLPDGNPPAHLAAAAYLYDEHKCRPWEEWDANAQRCVDKPHVNHYHGSHDPGGGEECWDECLCREGTYPGPNSCSPCSYEGTVCIQH